MNIIERVKNLLLSPQIEWEKINQEDISKSDLLKNYIIILAAIPAIAKFIGSTIFGINLGFYSSRIPVGTAFFYGLLTFILSIVGVYIIAFIIDFLAPYFDTEKNESSAFKIAAFSMTASWVGGIFNLIPVLGFLGILGTIYSFILFYMGLKLLRETPQQKFVGYYISILIVSIVVFLIISSIISVIVFSGYNI